MELEVLEAYAKMSIDLINQSKKIQEFDSEIKKLKEEAKEMYTKEQISEKIYVSSDDSYIYISDDHKDFFISMKKEVKDGKTNNTTE